MTFLPIVQRELRTAARNKTTRRIRWWVTLIAMVVCSQLFLFMSLSGGVTSGGNPLYSVLTSYAFLLSLFAGVFLTADCLSEERREGTLGLLFLTDLSGYDVVLGKFMARSLNAFYLLLALLPVTSLPLLLGGVTGGEFWRMALALLNALFFSLAAGLFVSAFSKYGQRAMGRTLALLVVLSVLPALNELFSVLRISTWWSCVTWVSPAYPFARAAQTFGSQNPSYSQALLCSNLLAWLFLALASFGLPRTWREEYSGRGSVKFFSRWFSTFRAKTRIRRKAQLLTVNPVLWLIGENRSLRRVIWVIVFVWAATVALVCLFAPEAVPGLVYAGKAGAFFLKMLLAVQACAFFAEARRTGALELLLCTPLANREILKGQWLALQRLFLWPFLIFLLLGLVPLGFTVISAVANGNTQVFDALFQAGAGGAMVCWFALGLVADVFAVAWVGMWLSLRLKKPGLAAPLTILFVLVLPSIAFCGLDVLADIFFILWAFSRLQQELRWFVARQYQ